MPRGLPDWGLVRKPHFFSGLDDLGEAVARLGSPVVWDRRGDVLFATDFHSGICGAEIDAAGVDSQVALGASWARHGAYCAELDAGTGTLPYARLRWRVPFELGSACGLEAGFSVDYYTLRLEAQVAVAVGGRLWYMFAAYNHQSGRVEYLDSAGDYTPVGDSVRLLQGVSPQHSMKLVVDTDAMTYVYFRLNSWVYDLRGLQGQSLSTYNADNRWFGVSHSGQATALATSRIDDVIITENEPI